MIRTSLRTFVFASLFGIAAASVACQPATTFNRGLAFSFEPSSRAEGQGRLVPSATALRAEGDQEKVKAAGGVYLGELEAVGERAGAGGSQGASALAGRVSLEAAARGATHTYLVASGVESRLEHARVGDTHTATPVAKLRARYALYRVEAAQWETLPVEIRPAGAAAATTAPAPPPAPPASAAPSAVTL